MSTLALIRSLSALAIIAHRLMGLGRPSKWPNYIYFRAERIFTLLLGVSAHVGSENDVSMCAPFIFTAIKWAAFCSNYGSGIKSGVQTENVNNSTH